MSTDKNQNLSNKQEPSSELTLESPLHRPSQHESAYGHVSGSALYVDDIRNVADVWVAIPVIAPIAHGSIVSYDRTSALQVPGVCAVLLAEDIPANKYIGPIIHDEPLLAEQEIYAEGQIVALVVGESLAACRNGANALQITYEEKSAILSISEAIAQQSYLTTPHIIQRGDVEQALASAHLQIHGEVASGGQDHFYLETQAALAIPGENLTFKIFSSTQHPTEVQAMVAACLGIKRHQVVVEVPRMGGGFGGKESQATSFAVLAALAAQTTGRPVKICLNRDQDMISTGKRHPFWSRFSAGFTVDGKITALRVHTYANGGWSCDLSSAILDRALFHLDNSYYIPNLYFEGRVVRTHVASNTAFRGFGGPQGMVVIEEVMSRAAERLGLDSAELRRRNYYVDGQTTPYEQKIESCRLQRIHRELLNSSDYESRRLQINQFNLNSTHVKRGIALQPVKFGISFTNSLLNQAGALVLVYTDGSIQINHGGTEMGQGLHTKMRAICAHELGVSLDQIRVMPTATDKVPNTSATAASSGSDLNGAAIQQACQTLRERLAPLAAEMLQIDAQTPLHFVNNHIYAPGSQSIQQKVLSFSELVREAWARRISLSALGFYQTPNIHYDRSRGQGKPFHYFAYGAAISEVEVNGLTGEYRLRRVDILHDVGNSLVPSIDQGQIEGAFIQGIGWLTTEELVWDKQGKLRTHGPSTYKIPAIGDVPLDFRVALLEKADQQHVVHGSKAVGEPPFMLAISVVSALRHAIHAFHPIVHEVQLGIPCTAEAVLRSIEDLATYQYKTEKKSVREHLPQ